MKSASLLMLILCAGTAAADLLVLTADSITATPGITNASNAFGRFNDTVAQTGAWQNTGDTATLGIDNFTANGTIDAVVFSIRMNTTPVINNDELAIQYSNDSGVSWFTVATGVMPPINLTIYGNYTVTQSFTQATILDRMMVRLRYTKNQGPDNGRSGIDGVEVYVSYTPPDTTPPNVTLHRPLNFTFVASKNVSFNYTATDDRGFRNCSIWINGTWNASNQTPITNGGFNYINITFDTDGDYEWNITCYDSANNTNTSNVSFTVRIDTTAPNVSLMRPGNGTLAIGPQVNFTYNVTDAAGIDNCALIINVSINRTVFVVEKDAEQAIRINLTEGNYTWSVNCTDANGFTGAAATWDVAVDILHAPNITALAVTELVVLNAGTTKTVECNITVEDADGVSEIMGANATFYRPPDTSTSADSNLSHYTNGSCSLVGQDASGKRFRCTAGLLYYAVNGSWFCNATAVSADGIGSRQLNFTVDPLFAINITTTVIDFGEVVAGATSAEVTEGLTNVGNHAINVTVYGKNLTCATAQINVSEARFAIEAGLPYALKRALTPTPQDMLLKIYPQTGILASTNLSYWQLRVPDDLPDTGACNGTIVFHAEMG